MRERLKFFIQLFSFWPLSFAYTRRLNLSLSGRFPYLAVGAVDCIVVYSVIPITTFFNSSPLLHCTFEYYVRKNIAIRERLTTDTRYAVADCYAFKSTATRERITIDSRYIVGDCDSCKSTAIKERIITDSLFAVYPLSFIKTKGA